VEDYGFGPEFRLKNPADFDYLKKGARSERSRYVLAYYKKSRLNTQKTRIAFSVSKKVGDAPKRNRIKRILKESFRHSDLKSSGLDILFVVSPSLYKSKDENENAEVELLKSYSQILRRLPKV
jgi:ribonuclease P protein component